MKYQLKGSTVTFTNRSVNLASVTGWKWYLDSGSGFAEVANTLNADITFPAMAGVTCTVKLVAEGAFGASEVKYEEQYMTVEDIPGPQLVSKTLTKRPFAIVDELMEVQAGTGAGDLTWELIGSETYGLSVNLTNGRLTGPFLHNDSLATKNITLRVTDALGRSHTGDITLVCATTTGDVSMTQVIWLDLQKPGAVVYDPQNANKISVVRSALTEGGDAAMPNGLRPSVQSTAVNQPVLVTDGQFLCAEFSNALLGLYHNNNSAMPMAYFMAVVDFYEAVATNKLFHSFYVGTTNYGSLGQNAAGLTARGYQLSADAPEILPSGKMIVGILPASQATNTTTGTDKRLVVNGVPRLYFTSTARPGVNTSTAIHQLGVTTAAWAMNAANFRVYEYVGWRHITVARADLTPSNTELNGIMRHLGAKYNIPVRTMLPSEVGWTGEY